MVSFILCAEGQPCKCIRGIEQERHLPHFHSSVLHLRLESSNHKISRKKEERDAFINDGL